MKIRIYIIFMFLFGLFLSSCDLFNNSDKVSKSDYDRLKSDYFAVEGKINFLLEEIKPFLTGNEKTLDEVSVSLHNYAKNNIEIQKKYKKISEDFSYVKYQEDVRDRRGLLDTDESYNKLLERYAERYGNDFANMYKRYNQYRLKTSEMEGIYNQL